LSEIFPIVRRTQRDIVTNVHISVFMKSTGYSCQILSKREFSGHIFEKYSNIKCNETPSNGSPVVLHRQRDSRTDRQTMTKLTVAFRNFANALKNCPVLHYNCTIVQLQNCIPLQKTKHYKQHTQFQSAVPACL
jgi:hypothetical protein